MKWGMLYEGISTDTKIQLAYSIVFIIRRISFCIIAFYIPERYSFFQVMALLFSNLGISIYIG